MQNLEHVKLESEQDIFGYLRSKKASNSASKGCWAERVKWANPENTS